MKETLLTLSKNKNTREWLLVALSGAMAIIAEIIAFTIKNETTPLVITLSLLAIAISGLPTIKKGLIAIRSFTLNINFLMMIAITGAMLIGEWPEAAMVTFLFALAEMIEHYSLDKARHAIRKLMEIAPDTALVKTNHNTDESWQEKPVTDIQLNDIIRVKPGTRIPLDGVIVAGQSNVNQAPITGESMPVAKNIGDIIYAGSINEQGVLEFRATALQANTMLSRIIREVQQAQSERAPTQRFVDQFAKYYTPIMVILAILIATVPPLFFHTLFYPWFYKALVLLVIACPCALVISTPVTVVSGLTAAAKKGILIKGGVYLEMGHQLKAIAFDKTGTLTEGKPKVTDFINLSDIPDQNILQLVASLENNSEHPIAKAILVYQQTSKLPLTLLEPQQFEVLIGRGVTAVITEQRYYLGNHRLAEEKKVCSPDLEMILKRLEKSGKTTIILADTNKALATFAVADTLRDNSRNALSKLHQMHIQTVMLTGDNPLTAAAIAQEVGIDKVYANLSPEEKLTCINQLLQQHHYVAMVGDGINDAPALAKASIGFAMGSIGSDAALETADVAIMQDNLTKLPEFIKLSKKMRHVLIQNITLAIGVKLLFFILALLGLATLWMAVFADMGMNLIVVMNGLRLLYFCI